MGSANKMAVSPVSKRTRLTFASNYSQLLVLERAFRRNRSKASPSFDEYSGESSVGGEEQRGFGGNLFWFFEA